MNKIGQAVVTQQAVAKAAGVHPSTVSLGLRNDPRLSRDTRARIRAAAARLGYAENPLVSLLMAQVRRRNVGYRGTLAYVRTASTGDRRADDHIQWNYFAGARRRAQEFGYTLDEFWLNSETRDPSKLARILEARVAAGVIVAHTPSMACPGRCFPVDLSPYPAVSLGTPFVQPPMNYVDNDQFMRPILAVRELLALGYRRLGMVIGERFDSHRVHRCSAGFWAAQQYVPDLEPIPVLQVKGGEPAGALRHWLLRHRPDAVLATHRWVLDAIRQQGWVVPEQLGWVHLDWLPDSAPAAGVYGNCEQVGAAAVEMVVSQIHRCERGIPAHPACHLIAGSWVPGNTLRRVGPPADMNGSFFSEPSQFEEALAIAL